jgi:chromosomal replication initiator protein
MKEWEQFLANLNKDLGASVVDLWLRPLRLIRFDAANLYLEAENPMQIAWFEEHIRPRLKRGFFNENHRSIKVHLSKESPRVSGTPKPYSGPTISFVSDPLDPSCTLENFCVTPNNAMTYKLLSEWAKTGSFPFNPIFIYGPKGSGKTHLLMGAAAICEKWGKKWLFATADTFTEHVVQAIRSSHLPEFRKIYRDIDVLIIDNVDRLANRTATQEEFFHTFNTLHLQGKQIILSSTAPPSKLTDIEFRLISRFEWGLPVGLGKADPQKILELKAKIWKFEGSAELLAFLLKNFPSDPITALQALILRFDGQKGLNPEIAKQILADLLRKEQTRSLTSEKIIKALATHFGITSEDITGKSQAREFALPRQIAMYLCREKLQLPYQGIGKLFERDHSTVMSSVKQIQQGIEKKDDTILEAVDTASRLHEH